MSNEFDRLGLSQNEIDNIGGSSEIGQLSYDKIVSILRSITETTPDHQLSLQASDVREFNWKPSEFNNVSLDRNNSVTNRLNYGRYEELKQLWLASATLSAPLRESIEAAYVAAQTISVLVDENKITQLENLIAGISQKAFQELCKFYSLPREETEALFDDNATLALYQFLSMTSLQPGDHIVTMFDVGRTLTQTLSGKKDQSVVFDYKPTLDVWQNKPGESNQDHTVGPFEVDLIEHYAGGEYKTDSQVMDEIYALITEVRPTLFLIPTVTRSGRLIPFVEICEQIKVGAHEAGYDPIVILDDAQGMSRLLPQDYKSAGQENIWRYADAVLGTGAKVTKAVCGTGFILINKDRFQAVEKPLAESSLVFRSRKYGFVSTDVGRMDGHNAVSPQLVNSSEIASLSAALQMSELSQEKQERLAQIREYIIDSLKSIPGISVLEADGNNVSSVTSIVTFYLENYPKQADKLRDLISQPVGITGLNRIPLSLPKVVPTDTHDYLRVSLDQSRLSEPEYLDAIEQFLARVRYQMGNFS